MQLAGSDGRKKKREISCDAAVHGWEQKGAIELFISTDPRVRPRFHRDERLFNERKEDIICL